jgi:hypothetical protein
MTVIHGQMAPADSLGNVSTKYAYLDFVPMWCAGREMENISRGTTFGDFVTIRTEGSMQDVTVARVARLQSWNI